MKADAHPRQAERLAALRSYGILDTAREKDFDEVVALAAQICEVPISVINFIDADRQWFKAEQGLGVRETPLDTSICSHVILEKEFVEIPDTLEDHRMKDNPLCLEEPGLRFYAGALLTSKEGLPLGTLCVLDHKPRTLTEAQITALRVLANQVMAQLNLRQSLREAEMLRREVDHRVKNSLQSIVALSRFASRAAPNDHARQAIDEMRGRIESVARVHEQLYLSGSGAEIALASYVENLTRSFREFAPDNLRIEARIDPVRIGSQQAASLGLLINEFFSNSVKHGFPDGQSGAVTIEAGPLEPGRCWVRLSDDGVGIKDGKGPGGLGMQIVELACAQLDTVLTFDKVPRGVALSLDFEAGISEPEITPSD
ncbi:histidine kinase dimerization/phosphoacceptor domain -containing protein [Roseovarius sp. C7]|uniref:histidine kinase dimerization/phosphoacceptor domain -containing protein n=1 Tax=Roseovarius sp. C7 TaxID=3398643 RepID=UPI0039F6A83C